MAYAAWAQVHSFATAYSILMGSSLNLPGAFARKIYLPFLTFLLNSLINAKVLSLALESDKNKDPDRETNTA